MSNVNLNHVGMLVNFHCTQWNAKKTDKSLSDEIAYNHGADENRIKAVISFIDPELSKSINSIQAKARIFHYQYTAPFDNYGNRFLPVALFNQYRDGMNRFADEFKQAVISADWDQAVKDGLKKLNGLAAKFIIPSKQEIIDRFTFKTTFNPVPLGNHLLLDSFNGELSGLQSEIDNRLFDAEKNIKQDILNRLVPVIQRFIETLPQFGMKATGKKKKFGFKDTLVTNVFDLCDILPAMNINGDPDIDTFIQDAKKKLTAYEPDTLRESPAVRQSVVSEAEALLKRINSYQV